MKRFSIITLSLLLFNSAYAANFTMVEGRLTDSGGVVGEEGADVDFTFEILSPGPEQCILFTETENNLDMTGTNGYFSFKLGDSDSAGFSNALSNATGTQVGLTCVSGSTYTPAAGDARKLRITYDNNDGGGPYVLSQLIDIGGAAYAHSASFLGGVPASDYLQMNNTGSHVLNQTNLENLFTTSNQTELMALIGGTSTQYLSASPSGAVSMNNQAVNNVAAPVAGTDATNKDYVDGNIGGAAADAAGIAGLAGGADVGKTLVWNGSQFVAQAPTGDSSKLPLGGGTMAGNINMGNQDITNANIIDTNGDLTVGGGIGVTNGINSGGDINIIGGNGLVIEDGDTNNVKLVVPGDIAANYVLTLPIDDGGANEVLQTDGSGNLSWVAGGSGTVTSVTAGGGLDGGTITASGTISIANNGVTSAMIADGAIANNDLATGSVDVAQIASNAVTTDKIADGAVDSLQLANDSVGSAQILANSVDTAEISDGAITSVQMANNAVGSAQLVDNSVTTIDLASGAVNTINIANNAVDSSKILSDTINFSEMADALTLDAATTINMGSYSMDFDSGTLLIDPANNRVGIGTIAPNRMLHVFGPVRVEPSALPGSPAAGDIAIDSGDSNKLKFYDGTAWIDPAGGGISADSITAVELADNSVGANEIADSSIMAWNLQSGYTADQFLKTDGAGNLSWETVPMDGGNATGATISIGTNDNQNLILKTNGTDRLTIDNNGNMIASGQLDLPNVRVNDGSFATPAYGFNMDSGLGMYRAGTGELGFAAGGGERIRILGSGHVGIGLTAPTQMLDVIGNIRSAGQFHANEICDSAGGNCQLVTDLGSVPLGSIQNNMIIPDAIESNSIALDTIQDIDIASNAVTSDELADNSVSSAHIVNGSIMAVDLTNIGVAPGKILQLGGASELTWATPNFGNFMADGTIAMSDSLEAFSGSATAPGLTFDGDEDTGFFNPGAEQVAFTANGSRQLTFTGAGGIHQDNSATDFALSDDRSIILHADSNGDSTGDIRFETGISPTTRMVIDSSGNVGIGTTNPDSLLHITDGGGSSLLKVERNSGSSPATIVLDNNAPDQGWLDYGVGATKKLRLSLANNGGVWQRSPVVFDLDAPDNSFVLDGSGKIGLETTTPLVSLDINTHDAIRIPAGTHGQRPGSPTGGMVRYNIDSGSYEAHDGTAWRELVFKDEVLPPAQTGVAGGTIDYAASHFVQTDNNCQSYDLHNLKDGGSYKLLISGVAPGTCVFSAYTDAGTSALMVIMPDNHGAQPPGKRLLYEFHVMGTQVVVNWTTME